MSTTACQNTITSRGSVTGVPTRIRTHQTGETCSAARGWLGFSIGCAYSKLPTPSCLHCFSDCATASHQVHCLPPFTFISSSPCGKSLKEHVGRYYIEARTRARTLTQRSSNRQRVALTKQFKVRFPANAGCPRSMSLRVRVDHPDQQVQFHHPIQMQQQVTVLRE
jgi:hypothetical protein